MEKYVWLASYCTAKRGAVKEFKAEWGVDRYMLRDKMFLMHGCDNKGREIITLKLEPMLGEALRAEYDCIVPGYYMNKAHWNSVYTDGNVPDELLKTMIDQSYDLILASLPKKTQKEILED